MIQYLTQLKDSQATSLEAALSIEDGVARCRKLIQHHDCIETQHCPTQSDPSLCQVSQAFIGIPLAASSALSQAGSLQSLSQTLGPFESLEDAFELKPCRFLGMALTSNQTAFGSIHPSMLNSSLPNFVQVSCRYPS